MGDLVIIAFRTIILYILVIVIFRLMGKREIGELSLMDLVVFMMIAEVAVIAIENPDITMMQAIVPMVFLMIVQILLAWISMKFPKIRSLVDGKPTIIIHNGKVDEKAMKKQRYNFNDLLLQLREQSIFNLEEVDFAILESSGKLTVMKKSADAKKEPTVLPLPLILDGAIQQENLRYVNISEEWLIKQLKVHGYQDYKKISFCSFHQGGFTIDEIDL